MKRCIRCKRKKGEHLFSFDKKRPDGLYLYCKACVTKLYHARYAWKERTPKYKAMRRAWRQNHPEATRTSWRRWDEKNRTKRRSWSRARYKAHRLTECARAKRVREKFKDHCRARWAVAQQIRYHGVKKKPCTDCGTTCKVQAHHHNGYDKAHWLDIVWLCSLCHGKRHHAEEI